MTKQTCTPFQLVDRWREHWRTRSIFQDSLQVLQLYLFHVLWPVQARAVRHRRRSSLDLFAVDRFMYVWWDTGLISYLFVSTLAHLHWTTVRASVSLLYVWPWLEERINGHRISHLLQSSSRLLQLDHTKLEDVHWTWKIASCQAADWATWAHKKRLHWRLCLWKRAFSSCVDVRLAAGGWVKRAAHDDIVHQRLHILRLSASPSYVKSTCKNKLQRPNFFAITRGKILGLGKANTLSVFLRFTSEELWL